VDRRIAEGLGLPVAGDDVQISGMGGNALAQPVRVARWRLAGIELPASTLDALDLSDGDCLAGVHGLLGSDTLCKFEVIHLDYKNQRPIFHTGPPGSSRSGPISRGVRSFGGYQCPSWPRKLMPVSVTVDS
jgi:Aspartyl protease